MLLEALGERAAKPQPRVLLVATGVQTGDRTPIRLVRRRAARRGRVALYGVSVFARPPGAAPVEVLRRFASSPYYLQATAGAVRVAGFDVLPTGANLDHFDVLLVDGRSPNDPLLPLTEVRAAAERLVAVCGDPRSNPAYPGGSHG